MRRNLAQSSTEIAITCAAVGCLALFLLIPIAQKTNFSFGQNKIAQNNVDSTVSQNGVTSGTNGASGGTSKSTTINVSQTDTTGSLGKIVVTTNATGGISADGNSSSSGGSNNIFTFISNTGQVISGTAQTFAMNIVSTVSAEIRAGNNALATSTQSLLNDILTALSSLGIDTTSISSAFSSAASTLNGLISNNGSSVVGDKQNGYYVPTFAAGGPMNDGSIDRSGGSAASTPKYNESPGSFDPTAAAAADTASTEDVGMAAADASRIEANNSWFFAPVYNPTPSAAAAAVARGVDISKGY